MEWVSTMSWSINRASAHGMSGDARSLHSGVFELFCIIIKSAAACRWGRTQRVASRCNGPALTPGMPARAGPWGRSRPRTTATTGVGPSWYQASACLSPSARTSGTVRAQRRRACPRAAPIWSRNQRVSSRDHRPALTPGMPVRCPACLAIPPRPAKARRDNKHPLVRAPAHALWAPSAPKAAVDAHEQRRFGAEIGVDRDFARIAVALHSRSTCQQGPQHASHYRHDQRRPAVIANIHL